METRRPLLGLLLAQFTLAFNDNAFKLIAVLLGMRAVAATRGFVPGQPEYERMAQAEATRAFVLLTLPFVLFSLPAGVLADRVSKRALLLAMKLLELALMVAATVALACAPPGHFSVLVLLFAMGVQSAVFSPAKYGILPEILPHERLSLGNGLVELWSFVGIVLGTVAGGRLPVWSSGSDGAWTGGLVLVVFAAVGTVGAWLLPAARAPAVAPAAPVQALRAAARGIWRDRPLRLAVIGIAVSWGAAGLLGQDMLVYGKAVLGLEGEMAAVPLAAFAVGVAGGAVLAGRLSAGNVEHGLIPLGALGVAVMTLALGTFAPGLSGTIVVMAILGASGGLVLVPLNALVQWRAPAARRGAVIAVANVFAFSAILAGWLGAEAMSRAGFDCRGILLGGGAIAMASTLWALWLLPDAFLRLLAFLITRSTYRMSVVGRANVPDTGPALLAPNHVSFMDGMFVMASLDRPVRFLVDKTYYEHWLLRPFMRALGFIPVQSGSGPDSVHRSLSAARDYLRRGEVVCIFPEGEISRTGAMLPFRRGIQRITENTSVPIVPVHLDRVWGSLFSFSGGRFLLKWPKRAPYPIVVSFGASLPSGSAPHVIRAAVQDLATHAWLQRRRTGRPLPLAVARRARRSPWSAWLLGRSRKRVARGRALLEAAIMARALRPVLADQERVALLFPTSAAGAIAALAVALAGRTAVWLDPRADAATWRAQAVRGHARVLLTSEAWLAERAATAPVELRTVLVEHVRAARTPGARVAARLAAMAGFGRWLPRACGARVPHAPDDVAAVVFDGERPVSLAWGALGAQVAALGQVLPWSAGDRIACSAGLHSALGQVVLWLGAARGLTLVMPSDDDAAPLGRAITRWAVDVLVTEPTMLPRFTQGCRPGQLGSLRCVLSLGTNHQPAAMDAFEAQFGLRPLAGLARADLGPIVSLSSEGFRAAGFYQAGARRGYVGHPLPGVRVKAVAADGRDLAPDVEGELVAAGPSLATEGWMALGLRGRVDADGYVGVQDALAPVAASTSPPRG